MSFFFSSRRRHTRFKCDWSSDVCSSDLIFASEGRSARRKNAASQQHVAGPSLPPVDHQPSSVSRPLIELALNDPLWRIFVKVRPHWSKHTIPAIVIGSLKHSQQPPFARQSLILGAGDNISATLIT